MCQLDNDYSLQIFELNKAQFLIIKLSHLLIDQFSNYKQLTKLTNMKTIL